MSRRRAQWQQLAAVVLILLGGSGALGADRLTAPSADTTLVDQQSTTEVSAALRTALSQVFSFDYQAFDRTQRAAATYLSGAAAAQYAPRLAAARSTALHNKLLRSTVVRAIGLHGLTKESVTALAIIDQQTLRDGANNGSSSSTVWLDVHKLDGTWKITNLTVY